MIARFFGWLLQLALDLAATVIRGLLGAPARAVEHAVRPIDIRQAAADEIVDVRHAVLREGRPRETAVFDGDHARDTRHWAADRSGIVIGVVTVIRCDPPVALPGSPRWQLRGMAVLPQYRGQHLGSALLEATHRDVSAPMWCNARQAVVAFYAKHGWEAVGPAFDIAPIGPHVRMVWRG